MLTRKLWIAAVLLLFLLTLFAIYPRKSGPLPDLASLAVAAQRPFDPSLMEEIDARKNPPELQFPQKDVVKRYRPWEPEEHRGTLVVENLRIHDVTNQKAIDIGLWSTDRPTPVEGEPLTYARVIVRNCEIFNVRRDLLGEKHGLHIDFLRICGHERQPFETDVLVEDVYIHDGNALPILIQEGRYNTITLRRVSLENTAHGVQIGFINTGYAKTIIIDQCPGLPVHLMGRPGSIEKCIVRDSPGAIVRDTLTANGRSGAQIITEETRPTALPAPVAAGPSGRPAAPRQPQVNVEPMKGSVRITLKDTPQDVAFIIFEAFDQFDYRLGSPQVITEAPWQADLKIHKTGPITVRVTITRLGGDPDKPLIARLEMPEMQKDE